MARTDHDRWDLATSVGATATMVAAQRALSSDANLIDDPYAAPLVRAVGIDVYVRLVDGEIQPGTSSSTRIAWRRGWLAGQGFTTTSSLTPPAPASARR